MTFFNQSINKIRSNESCPPVTKHFAIKQSSLVVVISRIPLTSLISMRSDWRFELLIQFIIVFICCKIFWKRDSPLDLSKETSESLPVVTAFQSYCLRRGSSKVHYKVCGSLRIQCQCALPPRTHNGRRFSYKCQHMI